MSPKLTLNLHCCQLEDFVLIDSKYSSGAEQFRQPIYWMNLLNKSSELIILNTFYTFSWFSTSKRTVLPLSGRGALARGNAGYLVRGQARVGCVSLRAEETSVPAKQCQILFLTERARRRRSLQLQQRHNAVLCSPRGGWRAPVSATNSDRVQSAVLCSTASGGFKRDPQHQISGTCSLGAAYVPPAV